MTFAIIPTAKLLDVLASGLWRDECLAYNHFADAAGARAFFSGKLTGDTTLIQCEESSDFVEVV